MAERLAVGAGKKVLLIDRRPHIGGNAHDRLDAAGVLIHQYGPHIFHTNSAEIFDYLSRFTEWRPYEHRVLAQVDGKLVPMPINRRSEEHTSELQSLMRISYAVFFLKKKKKQSTRQTKKAINI